MIPLWEEDIRNKIFLSKVTRVQLHSGIVAYKGNVVPELDDWQAGKTVSIPFPPVVLRWTVAYSYLLSCLRSRMKAGSCGWIDNSSHDMASSTLASTSLPLMSPTLLERRYTNTTMCGFKTNLVACNDQAAIDINIGWEVSDPRVSFPDRRTGRGRRLVRR